MSGPVEVPELRVELRLGPVSPSIADQLTAGGWTFDPEWVALYDLDVAALHRVYVAGYIPESAYRPALKTLFERVLKVVK